MNPRQAMAEAKRFVVHYRKMLPLDEWEFEFAWLESDYQIATFQDIPGRYKGRIRVSELYASMPSERDRRASIIHELLHAMTRNLRSAYEFAAPGEQVYVLIDQHEELMVDTLAERLVDFLPWGKS